MKGIRKPLDICFWVGLILAGTGLVLALRPTPLADPGYVPRVRSIAFRRGPSVLFDEAHWNAASAQGNFAPFVKLIQRDGYRVYRNRQEFVPELLAGYDNLVIVDPQVLESDEIAAVREWVRGGGNLLIGLSEGSAALAIVPLVGEFGVPVDTGSGANEPKIGDHPITRGRPELEEDLRRLAFVAGPALRGRGVILGSQCAAIESGKGRVVIISGPLALTAQRIDGRRSGINDANFDNGQLVLNIMHWLSRLI